MKINKKGAVNLILCAVYFTLIISSFYVILMKHSLFIERKNNIDFAINNAVSITPSMLNNDFITWKSIFTDLLEENCNDKDINFAYMLKKENNSFSLYDLNNTVNGSFMGKELNVEQTLSILNAYIKNQNNLDMIKDFAKDKASITCFIINKNIDKKTNKDYVIAVKNAQ